MRTAEDIVHEYRARGYPDDRIRTLANNRDEPMRSGILACLSQTKECVDEAGGDDVEAGEIMHREEETQTEQGEDDASAAECPLAGEVPEDGGVSADSALMSEVTEESEDVEVMTITDGVGEHDPCEHACVEMDGAVPDVDDAWEAEEASGDSGEAHESMHVSVDSDAMDEPVDTACEADAAVCGDIEDRSTEGETVLGVSETDLAWMTELEEVEAGLEDAVALDQWVENVLREAGVTPEILAQYAEDATGLQGTLSGRFAEDDESGRDTLAVNDLACSAEMIREAYRRAGVQLADGGALAPLDVERITPEEYFARLRGGMIPYSEDAIRATLQVIHCEAEEDDEDEHGIITLRPTYAVAPPPVDAESESDGSVMHEPAVAFSMETFEACGVADRARDVLGMRGEEELLLPCADFDHLARPRRIGERGADVPDERSLLAQWWFDLDAMGARPAEAGSFPEQSTAELAWTEERDAWRTDIATLQRKLENASESLTLQTLLAEERGAACRELEGRVERMTQELAVMQGATHELEVHASNVQEVESLLDAARMELDTVTQQLETMERAHNIAITETIPNLQADKVDLVDLIQEQEADTGTIRDELQGYRKRASYSMVAAAAASLLVVLLPVFHFVASPEPAPTGPDPILMAQLRQKDEAVDAMEAERQSLVAQVRQLESRYKQEQTHWENRLTAMTLRGEERVRDLQTKLQAMEGELLALRGASGTEDGDGQRVAGDLPYNNIRGVEEWQNRQRHADARDVRDTHTDPQRDPNAQRDRSRRDPPVVVEAQPRPQRTVTVRRGEGLSQVLWREMGASTPALVQHVAKANKLRTDRNGNPVIHPGQELTLPRSEEAALLR